MAAKIPAHVLIASFRFETAAGDALTRLKHAAKTQGLGIHAAVLKVSDEGKLSIKETADMTGRKGAVVGGVVGGVIGILGSTACRSGSAPLSAGWPRSSVTQDSRTRSSRTSAPCTAGRLAAHRRCGRESGRAGGGDSEALWRRGRPGSHRRQGGRGAGGGRAGSKPRRARLPQSCILRVSTRILI